MKSAGAQDVTLHPSLPVGSEVVAPPSHNAAQPLGGGCWHITELEDPDMAADAKEDIGGARHCSNSPTSIN